VLIAGTVPGVIAGSVIRVELLPGPRVFDWVVAAVLVPLGRLPVEQDHDPSCVAEFGGERLRHE
jgi:hypothetical protein